MSFRSVKNRGDGEFDYLVIGSMPQSNDWTVAGFTNREDAEEYVSFLNSKYNSTAEVY